MEIYFATGNKNKFREAKKVFEDSLPGCSLEQFEFSHNEIRSDSLEEISEEAVKAAYDEVKKPVFVEDAGLFIDALNGFPGTYSGWVYKKIGDRGILNLLKGEANREARFQANIAFHDANEIRHFHGICEGNIAEVSGGEGGFGYDPIFVPEGWSTTFAESIELKNKLSHRYKSLSLLINHLKQH